MATLARVHPDYEQHVLLVDRREGRFDPRGEAFAVIEIDDLAIQSKYKLLFQYTLLEMSTAAKPWLLSHLFDSGYDRVVYFDPDILLYAPLEEVEKAWSRGSLAVLTPHLTGRLLDDKYPGERDILLSGTYNLGFVALARHASLDSFLDYWREKSLASFAVDIKAGLFTDQKWIDPVPGMFPDVHIIRHEGYNVAYWNLPHRRVARGAAGFNVNGQPLVFFHFSGLDPQRPESLSRHQNRLALTDIGDGADLVRQYCDLVREAGYDACREWRYAFDSFDDGTPVLPEMRSWYRREEALREIAGSNPFKPGALDFNHVVVTGTGEQPPITRLMEAVYAARLDVQDAFRDIRGRDRLEYARWFITHGAQQHAIPAKYLDPIAAALAEAPVSRPKPSVRRSATGLMRALDIRPWLVDRLMPRKRETAVAELEPRAARRLDPDTAGFWEQNDEERVQGMAWMGPHATIRLGVRDGRSDTLTIVGEHSPALHTRAGNSHRVRLVVTLNGSHIGAERLTGDGRFVITMPLARRPGFEGRSETLGIRCDSAFVPAMFEGADIRTLSVRVKEVRVGDHVILDFSRHPRVYRPISEPAVPAFNIVGYATAASGVGQSARLCARSAEAAGLDALLVDCGKAIANGEARLPGIDLARPVNVLHANADQIPIVANLLGRANLRDRYNVGVWHWELGEFPDRWLDSFEPLQEIWAPSQFIQQAVAVKSPIPVVHMPHGVDVPPVGGVSRGDFGLPVDRMLFLLMYDMRSFHARKNPEAAIDSFEKAFPEARAAALVIKVMNGDSNPADLAGLAQRCRATPGVILIDEAFSSQRVHQLQSVCDCYVSLHRSEGFGFNLAESMLLGKPVIATAWSGNMDFMNAENACLVKYRLTSLETEAGPYWAGQVWAEPDVEHAAWQMTRLAADASLREDIGRAAAAHMSAHFSPLVAGERMRERLRTIGRMCPTDTSMGRGSI